MKRILMLTALLLVLAGCRQTASAEDVPDLNAIMAAAESSMAAELAEPEPVEWDGEYTNGVRSITLSLKGEEGLYYQVSDGGEGHAPEVNGTAAKAEGLLFSLSGDTLSVVGDAYTGNYERKT